MLRGARRRRAIYEWNYQRQLLAIRAAARRQTGATVEERSSPSDYLLKRPLLEAIPRPTPPVLLIDEVDRADEEFEAYLLEVLADFQITIPELGTITAVTRPHRGPDLERHARALGRAAPALPLRLGRLPRPRDGARASSPPVRRSSSRGSRRRSSASSRRCAGRTWRRSPASPRCSTGRRRPRGPRRERPHRRPRDPEASLACLLKTRADQAAVTTEVAARLRERRMTPRDPFPTPRHRPRRAASQASSPTCRSNGLRLGAGAKPTTALAALAASRRHRPATRRASRCKAVCTGCADEAKRFDALFDAYWLNGGRVASRMAPTSDASRQNTRTCNGGPRAGRRAPTADQCGS